MIAYPRHPRVNFPGPLAPSERMAAEASCICCIESCFSLDDLDPVRGHAFGRAGRVDVDGRLTGFFLFIAFSRLALNVKKSLYTRYYDTLGPVIVALEVLRMYTLYSHQ
jgi:hypothetical protein